MRRSRSDRVVARFELPALGLYVWGRKRSGRGIRRRAAQQGKPVVCLEDGFLRSLGLGPDDPALSLCVDDLGIYYDANEPSRLEVLIQNPLEAGEQLRAEALQRQWCDLRLSKYNGALESPCPNQPFVLVVDQTVGDLSIQYGCADHTSFESMLASALKDWPHHQIVVKVHPDVAAGRKRGYLNRRHLKHPRIQLCDDGGHPCSLLESCSAVYVVTSQLGFEGLLWGKQVVVFGMPFYAGWGLTQDWLPRPRRREHASPNLLQLVHAALVTYPRYSDPETAAACEPERVMQWLALQRRQLMALPNRLEAFGFTPWKARQLRRFLPRAKGQRLDFRPRHGRPITQADAALVWGRRVSQGVQRARLPTIQVEDGFLRSVGLGADLVDPLSWVFDHSGIYYDARGPSDLEILLRHSQLSSAERDRAKRLRELLLENQLSKYNLGGEAWQRPDAASGRKLVLVLGQVEGDASIRYGVPEDAAVRTNLGLVRAARRAYPEAWIIYKPHPDVLAGLRAPGTDARLTTQEWDEVVGKVSLESLFAVVDRVCTLTSLGGFEALLRGLPVSTWGLPFYAGWGLTDDRLGNHPWIAKRRGRKLDLEELTHASLIGYPCYRNPRAGRLSTPEQAVMELLAMRASPIAMSLEQQIFRWWGGLKSLAKADCLSRPLG